MSGSDSISSQHAEFSRQRQPSPCIDADRKQLIRHPIEQAGITVLGISEKVEVEVI